MATSLQSEFPELASLFAPPLRECESDDMEALLRQRLGIESLESFGKAFSKLRRTAKQVSRVVPAAMPVVGAHTALIRQAMPVLHNVARGAAPLLPVAGQIAGGMIGGPAGAMVGGAVGNVAVRAIGGQANRSGGPAATATLPGAMIGAPPAAAQLINLLGRPEVLRALMSMAIGQAGNSHVSAAGKQVPVAAIANLVGSLAQQAVEEYRVATNGAGEPLPDYLADETGAPCCDVGESDERANHLYGLLTVSDSLSNVSSRRNQVRPFESEFAEEWESYDDSHLFEDAELGELWANQALE
jgi:hypothetical protein